MEEQLYSVWVQMGGQWVFSEYAPLANAQAIKQWYVERDIGCRIHPRHKYTMKDVIEG